MISGDTNTWKVSDENNKICLSTRQREMGNIQQLSHLKIDKQAAV